MMDDGTYQVTPQILISPYTNRPVMGVLFKSQDPVYWCPLCCKSLVSPTAAHSHMTGRAHKNKEQDNNKGGTSIQKRELNAGPTAQEPAGKKMKEQSLLSKESNNPDLQCVDGVELKCELCNLVFHHKSIADEHFQGKKHKKKLFAKEAAEERKILNNWQSRKPKFTNRGHGNARAMGRGFVKPTGGTTLGYQKGGVLPGFVKASHGAIWGDQANIELGGVASSSSSMPTFTSNNSSNNSKYTEQGKNEVISGGQNYSYNTSRPLQNFLSSNSKYTQGKNEDISGGQNYSYNASYNQQSYHSSIPEYPSQPKENPSLQERTGYADQKFKEYSTSTPVISVDKSNYNNYNNYNYTVPNTSYTPNTPSTDNYNNNYTSQNVLPPTPYYKYPTNSNYGYQSYNSHAS